MVKVTGFKKLSTKDGREFITLELTGGVTLVQSSSTGQYYATVRKCSIPSTFDEATAQQLIGSEISGEILKQETDPYEYTNKRTGEVLVLNYHWCYQPSPTAEIIGSSKMMELETA
ncbi:hypothetical protein [Pedobacter steynii]